MAEIDGATHNRPLPDEDIGGDDAEYLRVARERYQKAVDADQDNREAALDDLRFMAGDQWAEEIRREREEDGRPVLTSNRMPQFVHQVTGDIRQNKPSIKTVPADDAGDEEVADIFDGLIRHIQQASDAGTAYVTAAEGAAQCGIGHFRVVTEYSKDDTFEQDIRIRRITDSFAVTWDPHAVEATRADARYCFVEETLDIATFKARYPKATTDGWDFQDRARSYIGDWLQHETVRVAEYWTKELDERLLALLSDGTTIDVTDMNKSRKSVGMEPLEAGSPFLRATSDEPLTVVRTRTVFVDNIQMRIINGSEVLEGPFNWAGRYIPIIPVIGEEIHIQRQTVRHGVIRHAKDPQRMYNYWISAQAEKVALEPKVPWLVTPGNIAGLESLWKQANTRNMPYLPYRPDPDNSNATPQRNAPQMGSSAMVQQAQVAADDMKATTGIYDAGVGARSNETSGVAIAARKQESDVSTFTYADNLARSIRRAGNILIDLIPKIYDTERAVRILNEDDTTTGVVINERTIDEAGKEIIVNDLSVGKYDVVVNTGPSYSTKRTEAAEGMMQLASAMPDSAAMFLDLIVQNLDWPGADEIAKRFRKMLPPGMVENEEGEEEQVDPAQEAAQQAQEAEMAAQQAAQQREDAEAQAKIEKTMAEAADIQAETEGQKLENAKLALELAVADGALEDVLNTKIEEMLTSLFSR